MASYFWISGCFRSSGDFYLHINKHNEQEVSTRIKSRSFHIFPAWGPTLKWVKLLSHVRLFATPWTVAHQAPPSMGFSRQEYWSGLPFPSPGDLPNLGIEPRCSSSQADALTSEPPGKLVGPPTLDLPNQNSLLCQPSFSHYPGSTVKKTPWPSAFMASSVICTWGRRLAVGTKSTWVD